MLNGPALRFDTAPAPRLRLHAPPPSLAGLLFTGWQSGAPPCVADADLVIDRGACRSMRCGHCGWRGLSFVPMQKGGAYGGVVLCPRCGECDRL